ncbi:hypothetical protein C3B44_03815 [Corynebacterium yudongzhengii]|uniref:DUF4235 domain-containing protein n=1 Tax=Corynebacterium yudongzhengii TaxID=2080740 RepID=A0A2U1T6D6_9CORY|nr:hypothetical protein [Corynebacterium yudongzhengii]AWB81595.1 hypothetical protein C3B44_03815 [Corynebacterium yudongzhengii]PWC01580.1 hypothetical protein DF222_06475 [Corynebacterium yudongzhengii]
MRRRISLALIAATSSALALTTPAVAQSSSSLPQSSSTEQAEVAEQPAAEGEVEAEEGETENEEKDYSHLPEWVQSSINPSPEGELAMAIIGAIVAAVGLIIQAGVTFIPIIGVENIEGMLANFGR